MLTIRTPIELKTNPSILTAGKDLAARIQANYEQVGSDLKSEDLLHLLMTPPEIYLAESRTNSLVGQTNNFQSRQIRLNLINNVLNRVLLSDTCGLTYQDEVFVTNILHKLGVTDVKEFIYQLQLLRKETKNRNELINIYRNNRVELGILARLCKQMQAAGRESRGEDEKAGEPPALWLHQSIIDRLQTGVIYREVRSYLSQRLDTSVLSRQEMQISEQSVMAEQILLNQLKNETAIETAPLVYYHMNSYEMGDANTYVTSSGQTLNEMAQAVLLRAVDQVYAIRYSELRERSAAWYELTNAVYETAANTFGRFEAYHNRTQLSQSDVREYYSRIQAHQSQEISALYQLLGRQRLREISYEPGSAPERAVLLQSMTEFSEEPGETNIYENASVTNENRISNADRLEQIENITQIREQLQRQINQMTQQKVQQIDPEERLMEWRELREKLLLQKDAQEGEALLHDVSEPPEEAGETNVYEDARMTNENYIKHQKKVREIQNLQHVDELLNQQLNRINQVNRQRWERMERLERELVPAGEIRIDRGKARTDALRAVEHPRDVLLEYMNTRTSLEAHEQERLQTLRELYDEDTLRIFETIVKYRKEPELLLAQGIVSNDPAGQLERDIQLQYAVEQETVEQMLELHEKEAHHEVEQIRTGHDQRHMQASVRRDVTQREVQRLELLHRENEAIDEKLLEELRTVNRQQTVRTTQVQEQQVNERTVVEENVINRINEIQLANRQELDELVGSKVRQQLRGMSEQVYQKLEKRMDTERRRRGM